MSAKTLMVQGTASDVGKSALVAALCRIFRNRGLRVAPFKAQNMALNSFVTPAGGEIGRAQAAQAVAAGVEPHVDMNPILMKPTADTKAQIIFLGRPVGVLSVSEYAVFKRERVAEVLRAFDRLSNAYDVVVLEGAGSPAEVNLKDQDIVNMPMAVHAKAPVLLAADIDRGGVFGSLVGTLELLSPSERSLVSGFLINKFRGERQLLQGGIDFLTQRTGIPTAGVIPYFPSFRLPQEDRLPDRIPSATRRDRLQVCVIRIPYLSNATDFDALASEPDVELRFVSEPSECDSADLLILPGSKNTIGDLADLRNKGFADLLLSQKRRFTVLGICAGYQMLGERILDPQHVESNCTDTAGLGLIPVTTQFARDKCTRQVRGKTIEEGVAVVGYQIHHGRVNSPPSHRWFCIDQKDSSAATEGFYDRSRRLYATTIHGIFDSARFRRLFLNRIRIDAALPPLPAQDEDADQPYREWAEFVEPHMDMPLILSLLEKS